MRSNFDEQKATEIAARFLKLRGDQMHYLKLIKLLYLLDREALGRWGVPVTTDVYVSMPHGPVTSQIYDLLIGDEIEKPFWEQYISAPRDYQVSLLKEAPADKLSRAEEALIQEIFERYGRMNRWEIRDLTHRLPEWKDPHGSSFPIEIREILAAQGFSVEEVAAILKELNAEASAQVTLQRAS